MMNRNLMILQILLVLPGIFIIFPVSAASVPAAGFLANLTAGTAPLPVQFLDTSTNSPAEWIWSFGDGETSSAQNPVHTYTRSGTYSVTLAATNAQGSNTMTMNGYIVVGKSVVAPAAGFVSNVTSGTVPVAVQFLDTSANSPTTQVWSFGDGSTGTGTTPVHVYAIPGVYDVTLTAANSAGSSTATRAGYITAVAPSADVPSAWFVSTTTGGKVPVAVQFVDASTNFPVSWSWSFGDGETSTLRNPLHTYTRAGTYNVSLTATNSYGSHTVTRANYIAAGSGIPEASFSATPLSGTAPLEVRFTDTSTNSPGAWYWSFGDGNVSSAQNPVYVYPAPGVYTVSFSATNLAGTGSVTKSSLISVGTRTPPVASFTADTRAGPAPLSVRFTDTSSGSPDTWSWSFGDGAISAAQNPLHTYMNPGSYTVTLTAANTGGSATVSRQDYIVVSGPASGTVTPTVSVPEAYGTGTAPGAVQVPGSTAAASGGAATIVPVSVLPTSDLPVAWIVIGLFVLAGIALIWWMTRSWRGGL